MCRRQEGHLDLLVTRLITSTIYSLMLRTRMLTVPLFGDLLTVPLFAKHPLFFL